MIYFSSDFHFNHNKEFVWQARGFNSVDEMNQAIVQRMNERVKEDDILYILGDLVMGEDLDSGINLINQIKCKNKAIILGNHDTTKRKEAYIEKCGLFLIQYATVIKYQKTPLYLSHYPTITNNADDNSKPVLKRLINLCGHTHTTDKFIDMKNGLLSYHVEVDAHNCYPISIEEILQDIQDFNRS